MAALHPKRERLGKRSLPHDIQQHPTHHLRLTRSLPDSPAGRRVALPYHKWWEWCKKRFGDSKKGLWIRNNGSTMVSQLLNTLLYTLFAFYGTYSTGTLISIFASSYVIYIITSLLDTPFVYWARNIHEKHPEIE